MNWQPWQPETHYKFPDDHGSTAHATLSTGDWRSKAMRKSLEL